MAKTEPETSFLQYLRTSDPACLARVFDQVAPELLRVTQHLTQDAEQAEDAVQQSFLTLIEKGHTFDRKARLVPWLLAIAANHVRQGRRKLARTPESAPVEPIDEDQPTDAATRREVRDEVDAALRGIPNPYRQVLALHLQKHVDTSAIAKALGRPLNTVRSQVRRGLDLLRQALPAGLATGAAVGVTTGRGLAAVRAEVLAAAAARPVPVATGTTLGARLVLLLLLAVALPLGVWWVDPFGSSAATTDLTGTTDRTADASDRPAPETRRDRVTTPDATPATDGPLIRVVDEATGRPVQGAAVVVLDDQARRAEALDIDAIVDPAVGLQGRFGWQHERKYRALRFARADRRYHTDERGEVRIGALRGKTTLHGTKGDRIGCLPLFPASRHGHRLGASIREVYGDADEVFELRLSANQAVRVLVVTADGKPVPNLPVELEGRGGFPVFGRRLVTTDATGHATFPDLADVRHVLGKHRRGTLRISTPLATPVEATVDLLDPPREPVRLTMPATRELRIRIVDRLDRPVRGISRTFVAFGERGLRLYVEDGELTVPGVAGAGTMSLEAIVPGGGRRFAKLEVTDDAELVATLRPAADTVFLRGQLIGAAGNPVAEKKVTFGFRVDRTFAGGTLAWRQVTTTLADGAFELEVTETKSIQRDCTVRVFVHPEAKAVETSAIARRLPSSKEHVRDLGTVQLRALTRLAAGRVVDPDGEPLDASVRVIPADSEEPIVEEVEGQEQHAGKKPPIASLPVAPFAHALDDGRFVVFGRSAPRGTYYVRGFAARHDPNTVRLQPGRDDLQITLTAPLMNAFGKITDDRSSAEDAALEGSVQLTDGVQADRLKVYATVATPGHARFGERLNRWGARVHADGYFHISGLPAERVRVEVWTEGGDAPLRTIGDVTLRPRIVLHDSRLDEIELAAVRTLRVSLRLPNGAPLPKSATACAWFRAADASKGDVHDGTRQPIDGDALVLPIAGALDVDLIVDGFRKERLRNVTNDRIVQLRPGVPVTVLHPDLPADLRGELTVMLRPARPREPRDAGDPGGFDSTPWRTAIGGQPVRTRKKLAGTKTVLALRDPGTIEISVSQNGRGLGVRQRITITERGAVLRLELRGKPLRARFLVQ